MTIYNQANLGHSISEVVQQDDLQDEAIRTHERGAVEPSVLADGLLWWSVDNTKIQAAAPAGLLVSPATHSEALLYRSGGAWRYLVDGRHAALNAGGTVKPTADQDFGGKKITNLGVPSAATDHARHGDVLLRSGANAATGNLPMGGNRITGLGEPVDASDAVRLGDLAGMASVTGKFVQHTAGTPILVGGTSDATVHRFIATDKPVRRVTLYVEAEARRDVGGSVLCDAIGQIDIVRIAPESGQDFRRVGHGRVALRRASSVVQVRGLGNTANPYDHSLGSMDVGDLGPKGGQLWRSDLFNPQFVDPWRLYIEFFDGNFGDATLDIEDATGVQIYARRESDGAYLDFCRVGDGAVGGLQVQLIGWD